MTIDTGKLFKNWKTYVAAAVMAASIILEHLGYIKESKIIWEAGIVLGVIGFRHKMGRIGAKMFLSNKEDPILLTDKHKDPMEDVRKA